MNELSRLLHIVKEYTNNGEIDDMLKKLKEKNTQLDPPDCNIDHNADLTYLTALKVSKML